MRASFAALIVCCCIAMPLAAQLVEPIPDNAIALAVNAGGPALPDQGFVADTYAVTGQTCEDTANGNGLQPQLDNTIHETMRCDPREFSVSIPVGGETYDLELHFVEIWHANNAIGSRVMNVFVEDQLVLENLDVLAENGGDVNIPIARLIEDVDPALSGDPNAIDITIRSVVDWTVLTGFRVVCPDRTINCKERYTAALARKWFGVWERTYRHDMPAGDGTAAQSRLARNILRSTDAGVHVALDIGWLVCEVVFSVGVSPAEMTHQGDTCAANVPLTDWRLSEQADGQLRLSFLSGGEAVSLDLFPTLAESPESAIMPDGATFDLVGVNLADRVGTIKALVQETFPPRDHTNAWSIVPGPEGIVTHRFVSAEGGAAPVETFQIYAVERRGRTGDDALPIGVLRKWRPEPQAQPSVATLLAEMQKKYGTPTADAVQPVDPAGVRRVGLIWSLDRSGGPAPGGRCNGRLLDTWMLPAGDGLPEREVDLFDGCGFTLEAVHAPADPDAPVSALQLLLTDASRLIGPIYDRATATVADDIARVVAQAAAAAAVREALDAIKPRL